MHPIERGKFDIFLAEPWALMLDHLGLVETIDGLGEGIVIRVTDAADGSSDLRLFEALGILDRKVLHAAIAMMGQLISIGVAGSSRLLQRVENQLGVGR